MFSGFLGKSITEWRCIDDVMEEHMLETAEDLSDALMGKPKAIWPTPKDNRKISALIFPDASSMEVGMYGVDKITAYQESGDMAHVTWFAVYVDGKLKRRVNAAHVAVVSYF